MISRTVNRCLVLAVAVELLAGTPAHATFHFSRISEVLTSYNSSSEVQFVEMNMLSPGQNLVSGTKLNAFDSQGNFVETVLTVPSNVISGAQRKWIMGTPAFETASGLPVDFEFPNGKLPPAGGMICWGKPGDMPTPVSCDGDGVPYVDCIAYGNYSGPSNTCTGTPTPLSPDGHTLQRAKNNGDNAGDFVCADNGTPTNNSEQSVALPATTPCPGETTTTVPPSTTLPATTTTSPSTSTTGLPTTTTLGSAICGDATGDGSVTASDALLALRTAVGSASCAAVLCDVDDSGAVTAGDALRILAHAVGQDVALTCPAA